MTRRPFSLPLKQDGPRRAAGLAGTGQPGSAGRFPLSRVLTCLAKNLPSSPRLFSFLAAIKRSGAAATSSERCSMTAGPLSREATSAPCSTLRAAEPPGFPGRSCHQLRPPRPGRAAAAAPPAPGEPQHTWGSTRRSASSARDADADADGRTVRPDPTPSAAGTPGGSAVPVAVGEFKQKSLVRASSRAW